MSVKAKLRPPERDRSPLNEGCRSASLAQWPTRSEPTETKQRTYITLITLLDRSTQGAAFTRSYSFPAIYEFSIRRTHRLYPEPALWTYYAAISLSSTNSLRRRCKSTARGSLQQINKNKQKFWPTG